MSHSESRHAAGQGQRYHAFTQPLRTIEICASQSGRIDEVLVRRGDHVDAKTVLMRLDRRVLLAQREIAKQESQAVARLDALVVEQKLHEDRLQQVRELLSDGAGSREEVRRAEADAAVASLNVEAARENKQLAKLRLDEIDAKIAEREVRGSVDGWVIDVLKDSGEYVSMNSPHVITLVQLQQLRATFYVPTQTALRLTPKQEVTVQIESHDAPVQAQVEYIGVVTQADSGRVRLDVLMENSNSELRSGMRCSLGAAHE